MIIQASDLVWSLRASAPVSVSHDKMAIVVLVLRTRTSEYEDAVVGFGTLQPRSQRAKAHHRQATKTSPDRDYAYEYPGRIPATTRLVRERERETTTACARGRELLHTTDLGPWRVPSAWQAE